MAKRPTIIDVAKLAGVSKATVGRVINGQNDIVSEDTRSRVMHAVKQLGYERNAVAGSLRTDRTFMIALAIPDITNPFWPEVARGVQDAIEAQGYATVTVNTDWKPDREQKYLTMVRRNRFDGLIVNPIEASRTDLLNIHIPVVILGSGGYYPDMDSVGSDTAAGVEIALNHLLELGHQRIALITGRPSRNNRVRSRHDAYVAFHAKHNLQINQDLIIEKDFSEHSGYEAMHQLLHLDNPPTAVFAANDILAIGALKGAQALDWHVPEDVSIVGMDDIYAAATTSPSLTTIVKPKYETGVKAAEYLLARMSGDNSNQGRHILLPCELAVRSSTAPPRQR